MEDEEDYYISFCQYRVKKETGQKKEIGEKNVKQKDDSETGTERERERERERRRERERERERGEREREREREKRERALFKVQVHRILWFNHMVLLY